MSAVDLHPEDLLDRERAGRSTPSERRELDAHLVVCDACRFERQITEDFAREAAPREGDADRLARILAKLPVVAPSASAAPAPAPVPAPVPLIVKPRASRKLGRASFVAVLLIAAAGAAAQSRGLGFFRTSASPETSSAPTVDLPAPPAVKPAVTSEAPVEVETAAPIEAEPEPTTSPTAEPEARVEPRPQSAKAADPASQTTPDSLFREANQARRDGRTSDAVRLYRELQRRFPTSGEAAASRLSLARLMLDGQQDSKGALGMFDGYLKAQPQGTLSEEALLGRALSLQKLGRAAEERAAWQELMTKYPSSVHLGRARERLKALH